MENYFDKLYLASSCEKDLDAFLENNMLSVFEFYNSDYKCLQSSVTSISKFILLKHKVVSKLDFSKSYAKSFALILLDFCMRFNLISETPRILNILHTQNILINKRLEASLLYLYPKPNTNTELINKFDLICDLLQIAIETEEDNEDKVLGTFLNYYSVIINDTNKSFAIQVKNKTIEIRKCFENSFLQNVFISELLNIEFNDMDIAYNQVQSIIDIVLDKRVDENSQINVNIQKNTDESNILIESNTKYCNALELALNNFKSIRNISIQNAHGVDFTNRGVKIIDTEEQLFEYMKRFGNMHKAKMLEALNSLPNNKLHKVNIIDWGCGQGIASMLYLEKIGIENINNITLIEPSRLAIKRCALHLRKYHAEVPLITICKKIDDLVSTDFIEESANLTINLFSNILDIDDYNQSHLINLIENTQIGTNFFACVSPYIDDIKTERLDSFKRHFESKYLSFNLLLEKTNTKKPNDEFWCCNNIFKYPNATHESFPNCMKSTINGCTNKWTRVIKVFSVSL